MNPKKPKVRLWSVLTALTAILTIAAIVGNMIANQYATTLNVALNASTYKIIKATLRKIPNTSKRALLPTKSARLTKQSCAPPLRPRALPC